ncbi:MAG: GNAT family N-acetyltransferase [Lachnospiraceae bacterium]|nr:GNAT family N-acetyltransferase [Lachnospiraceae bacterium]
MELIRADISDFDTIFEIMDNAFPNTEMRTYQEQKKIFEIPQYSVLMNEEKTAFIAQWDFNEAVYIEHFAVMDSMRGKGTGKNMLTKFLNVSNGKVFLEVEPPEGEIARRRIGFYEKAGFVLNQYYYLQPPYRQNEESIELKIMTMGEPIDQKQFDEYKKLLYSHVYKYKKSKI